MSDDPPPDYEKAVDLTGGDDEEEFFPDPVDSSEAAPAAAPTEEEQLSEAIIESLLEELGRLKDLGNTHFKAGQNAAAVSAYTDAVKKAAEGGTAQNFKDAVKPVLISLHSNCAAAQLKLEEWSPAAESAGAAIELDATNAKALYRRGLARSRLGMLSSAKDDLMAAAKLDPKNRDARTELATVQAGIKAQAASSKASFAEKFGAASEKAVAKEEAKEAARKKEEDKAKAAAEAALREEWKAECTRLRAEERTKRETARLARLRKFLGDDAAAAAAAEVSDSEAAAVAASRDVSEWAREELRERLAAVETEEEDDEVIISVGPADGVFVSGSASVTPTAIGNMPEYACSAKVPWRALDRKDRRPIGTGTLSYGGIAPLAGGAGLDTAAVYDNVKEEVHDNAILQTDPSTPPGRAESDKARAEAALTVLKRAVQQAFDGFAAAIVQHTPPPAAAGGEGEGEAFGDEPITFEAFKEAREKAKKAAEEKEEAEKKKAKDARDEERRRARKEERVKVDDADLAGMKGYKTRADGSKTSYFTRDVDPQTKALLDAQKAPKRLSVGAAPPAEAPVAAGAGSAWNTGGTWEEKDYSEWAKGELEQRLGEASASHEGLTIEVSKVADLEGSASVVASRGASRHLFDYGFSLEYKVSAPPPEPPADADAEEGSSPAKTPASVCKGKLAYTEVAATKEAGAVQIGGLSNTFKKAPAEGAKPAALAAVEALKASVQTTLAAFDADYRTAKRV